MAQQNVAQSASTSLQSSAVDTLRNSQSSGLAPHLQTQAHRQNPDNHRLSAALPTENPLASPQVMPLEAAFAAATQPHQTTLAQSLQNRAPGWLKQGLQGMQQWLGTGRPESGVSPLPQTQGPLIGIIDTGFAPGEHGHQMLQTIQSGNPDATILLADSVGKGTWADSLTQFVDTAKATGQTKAVVNASFDLTQKNPDGSITSRQELTAREKAALNYARENGVLVVASAGNEAGAMSALGQASGLSDNLIVVGSAQGNDRAAYSSFGKGLDFLFANTSDSSAGTSASAAKTTQTIAQIWAANPNLTSQQVVQTLEASAIDLQKPGWDATSGLGIVNPEGALRYAATVASAPEWMTQMGFTQPANNLGTPTWSGSGAAVATERSNWNLRRVAAGVRSTLRPPSRRRPRGSGVVSAVRRGAAAVRRIQPPSRQRPRGSGVANAIGRGAAAVRNNLRPPSRQRPRGSGIGNVVRQGAAAARRIQPPSRQRPRGSGVDNAVRQGVAAVRRTQPPSRPNLRGSGVANAIGRGAAAVRNNLRPPSRQRPRGAGVTNAFRGSTALRRYLQLPGRPNPRGSGLAGAITGGATALGRRLTLPGERVPRGSQFAGAIAGGGVTALRRHLQLPGRPNPRGSGLAGAIAGGAVALGRRLPLPGRPLSSGFRAGDAIARAQGAIRQIRQSPLSPSPLRGLLNPAFQGTFPQRRNPGFSGLLGQALGRLPQLPISNSFLNGNPFRIPALDNNPFTEALANIRGVDSVAEAATSSLFGSVGRWLPEGFNVSDLRDSGTMSAGPTDGQPDPAEVWMYGPGGSAEYGGSQRGEHHSTNPEDRAEAFVAGLEGKPEEERHQAIIDEIATAKFTSGNNNNNYAYAEELESHLPEHLRPKDPASRSRWEGFSPVVHGILQGFGLVPGVGVVPDIIDAAIYAAEGNRSEAAFSAAAAVPGVGDVGRVARWFRRGRTPTPNPNPPSPPSPSGRTPDPEAPGGPSGRSPDAPNPPGGAPNPGGAAPAPRPAPQPLTGGSGRDPGSGSSPGGSEPPAPSGSPANPPRPQPNPPAQNPPLIAGQPLPQPHRVDPSRGANPGGGGPRTPLHGRPPSGRDSNEVPVLVGDRTPSGPQNSDAPTPRSGGSGRNENPPNHPDPGGLPGTPTSNSPGGIGPGSGGNPLSPGGVVPGGRSPRVRIPVLSATSSPVFGNRGSKWDLSRGTVPLPRHPNPGLNQALLARGHGRLRENLEITLREPAVGSNQRGILLRLPSGAWNDHILTRHVESFFRSGQGSSTVYQGTPQEYFDLMLKALNNSEVTDQLDAAAKAGSTSLVVKGITIEGQTYNMAFQEIFSMPVPGRGRVYAADVETFYATNASRNPMFEQRE